MGNLLVAMIGLVFAIALLAAGIGTIKPTAYIEHNLAATNTSQIESMIGDYNNLTMAVGHRPTNADYRTVYPQRSANSSYSFDATGAVTTSTAGGSTWKYVGCGPGGVEDCFCLTVPAGVANADVTYKAWQVSAYNEMNGPNQSRIAITPVNCNDETQIQSDPAQWAAATPQGAYYMKVYLNNSAVGTTQASILSTYQAVPIYSNVCSNTCGDGNFPLLSWTCIQQPGGNPVANSNCTPPPATNGSCTGNSTCTNQTGNTFSPTNIIYDCNPACDPSEVGTLNPGWLCQRNDGKFEAQFNCINSGTAPSNHGPCTNPNISTSLCTWAPNPACNDNCGATTQPITPVCLDTSGNPVPTSECAQQPAPVTTESCAANWRACALVNTGDGSCNTTCGTGTKPRNYICEGGNPVQTAALSHCPPITTPTDPCSDYSGCQPMYAFANEHYQCSVSCGGGQNVLQSYDCTATIQSANGLINYPGYPQTGLGPNTPCGTIGTPAQQTGGICNPDTCPTCGSTFASCPGTTLQNSNYSTGQWTCVNNAGVTSPQCSVPPQTGACGTSDAQQCAVGNVENQSPDRRTWDCAGLYGGGPSTQCVAFNYSWVAGATTCSQPCGGGMTSTAYSCIATDAYTNAPRGAGNADCELGGAGPEPTPSGPCNTQSCGPAYVVVTHTTPCSTTCGYGQTTVSYSCVDGNGSTVGNGNCPGIPGNTSANCVSTQSCTCQPFGGWNTQETDNSSGDEQSQHQDFLYDCTNCIDDGNNPAPANFCTGSGQSFAYGSCDASTPDASRIPETGSCFYYPYWAPTYGPCQPGCVTSSAPLISQTCMVENRQDCLIGGYGIRNTCDSDPNWPSAEYNAYHPGDPSACALYQSPPAPTQVCSSYATCPTVPTYGACNNATHTKSLVGYTCSDGQGNSIDSSFCTSPPPSQSCN